MMSIRDSTTCLQTKNYATLRCRWIPEHDFRPNTLRKSECIKQACSVVHANKPCNILIITKMHIQATLNILSTNSFLEVTKEDFDPAFLLGRCISQFEKTITSLLNFHLSQNDVHHRVLPQVSGRKNNHQQKTVRNSSPRPPSFVLEPKPPCIGDFFPISTTTCLVSRQRQVAIRDGRLPC